MSVSAAAIRGDAAGILDFVACRICATGLDAQNQITNVWALNAADGPGPIAAISWPPEAPQAELPPPTLAEGPAALKFRTSPASAHGMTLFASITALEVQIRLLNLFGSIVVLLATTSLSATANGLATMILFLLRALIYTPVFQPLYVCGCRVHVRMPMLTAR